MTGQRFFDIVTRLDALIERNDVAAAMREMEELQHNAAAQKYFFDRLQRDLWLDPLKKAGFFREPPALVRGSDGGTINFPLWPAAEYLARMARVHSAQQAVLEIALQITDTDNVRVHETLTELALALPPELAVQMVVKAKKWIDSPYQILLPDKLGALFAHLARGGYPDQALDLARTLLAVVADPRAADLPEEARLSAEPVARFDVWRYEQILKKHLDEVVDAAGAKALSMLCDLLESAVTLSRHEVVEGSAEDYSWVWRPAIEDHEQNRRETVRTLLVSAVRDASERIAARGPESVGELALQLEQRRWLIFRRTALHLLRRYPARVTGLVEERLTNRELFDDLGVRHEYVLLAAASFPIISDSAKQTLLDWITDGPDLEEFRRRYREEKGTDLSDDDLRRYADMWRRDRLAPLKHVLPSEWARRYSDIVAAVGEPEHPEFAVYMGTGWVGPTSPQPAAELRTMSVAEIVSYLRTWVPPTDDWMTPSREGLGRELTGIAQAEAARFATEAHLFVGLNATYVRAVIRGLSDAAKEGRPFDWLPVVRLCEWVVAQPTVTPSSRIRTDEDPGWGWSRKAIGSLLCSGFAKGAGEIPFALRTRAWAVLRTLTDDPEPTPEYEAQYGGANMDPATLSINTVRGEAMHAVIQYALWTRRNIEQLPGGATAAASGFEAMPEVREVLESHLDLAHDPSLAIRAVYGQWFPWIVLLDRQWASAQLGHIFSSTREESQWRDAAWDTYVVFCAPYDNVFEVLEEEYARAIGRISSVARSRPGHLADPDERLAEHLMLFYGRGKVSSDSQDRLIEQFFDKAPSRIRARAIEFIGRSLRDSKGDIPRVVLDRFIALWNRRLDHAREVGEASAEEIARFGWWFISERFEDSWAVEQLEEVLRVAKKAEPDLMIPERLAAIANRMPGAAVRCLVGLVEADREGWGILAWEEHARTILRAAMTSSDSSVGETAVALIHRLGARGRLGLRDLLGSS